MTDWEGCLGVHSGVFLKHLLLVIVVYLCIRPISSSSTSSEEVSVDRWNGVDSTNDLNQRTSDLNFCVTGKTIRFLYDENTMTTI
jgi:hypothetical protein